MSTYNTIPLNIKHTVFPSKKRLLCVRKINIEKVFLHFKLEFYTSEGYIEFLFRNFNTNVKKINNQLIITIYNPIEIISILETPYNKMSNIIRIHHRIDNKYGKLDLYFNITKDILFKKLDQKNISEKKYTKSTAIYSKESKNGNNTVSDNSIPIQKTNHRCWCNCHCVKL